MNNKKIKKMERERERWLIDRYREVKKESERARERERERDGWIDR
jgi:hypothetical protein